MILEMLLWGIGGALIGGAVGAIIDGIINRQRLREIAQSRDLRKSIVRSINRCDNIVKLEDLESGKCLTVQGDGIADDVRLNGIIYA